jgi:hypothetical protein
MPLDLPPPYAPVALREAGDAFAHACAVAARAGAGTLVWVRRFDLAECAVVLEPEEPLAVARQVIYAGLNAAADALAVDCPPGKPISFDWPDAIRVDGALVGGGRLAWPLGCAEHAVPARLVFGLMLRVHALEETAPGHVPPPALADEGFADFDTARFVGSFARHFMVALDAWTNHGPRSQWARWQQRAAPGIAIGDLATALTVPSWLDPARGEPWS